MRGWLWLANWANGLAVLWGIIWFFSAWQSGDNLPMALYLLGLLGIALIFLKGEEPKWSALEKTKKTILSPLFGADYVVVAIMGLISLLVFGLVRIDNYTIFSVIILGAVIAIFFASAFRWRSLNLLAPVGAGLFALTYLLWDIERVLNNFDFNASLYNMSTTIPSPLGWFITVGISFAVALGLFSFWASLQKKPLYLWTLVAVLTPLFVFAYSYLRATSFSHSLPFGLTGLALTFCYIMAADYLDKHKDNKNAALQSHNKDWAVGIYAAAAVGALSLSFTILMEKGWLTMALALTTPALAWISLKRPVPALRYLIAGMAAIVAVRLFLNPRIIGSDLGTTPIFNWLLYGYGVPTIAFAWASRLLLKQKDDITVWIMEAAAITFGTVFLALQARHLMNDGNVFSYHFDLSELAIHTTIGLGLSLGLQMLYKYSNRTSFGSTSEIIGLLGMASALLGHLLLKNPYFTNNSVGDGLILNELLLAYAWPALLAGLLFMFARYKRSQLYVLGAGITSLLLAFTYATLQTRFTFQGSQLGFFHYTSNGENYAYSVVWLLFGGLILITGILLNKKLLRFAGLPILLLTICKVFLYDMAALDGFLRALSFIGLGFSLVGIGYLYQNFVLPPAKRRDTLRQTQTP